MLIRCHGVLISSDELEAEINSLLLIPQTPYNPEFWVSDKVSDSECLDIDVVINPSADPLLLVLNCNTIDDSEVYQINSEFETHNLWISAERFKKFYDAYNNGRRILRRQPTQSAF